MRRPRHRVLGWALALALAPASVRAQTPQPWSVGVTAAQKTQAQQHLDAGNASFLERKYAAALESYRRAVAAWDHPAIRFNIVRCLIQLDRPVEASDHLKEALKYGAAPLEEAVYNEALTYEKLLANEIAELTVECSQPGVKLTLDGQPLPTCPHKETRRIAPGAHQVVGIKEGLLTRTVEVFVLGGKQQTVTLTLDPVAKAARVEHRWAGWVPWVVFGSGFGIATIGGLLDLSAASDMESYDRTVTQQCSSRSCAEDDPRLASVADLDDTARMKSNIAVSVMIAGGAAVVTGAVMLYLNRGRTVYPESVTRVSASAVPGGATVTLDGSF